MGTAIVILLLLAAVMLTVWRFSRIGVAPKNDWMMVVLYLASLLVWFLCTAWLAHWGFYRQNTGVFAMSIATLVPLVITGMFLLSLSARRALSAWTMSVPLGQLIWVHIIRLAAIGTIVKMLQGILPAHFIVPVGIPDFLFALTVPAMVWLVFQKKVIGSGGLIAWNIIGLSIFLPTLVLIHLSVPSPIQVYFDGPNTYEVFQFPMALVPTFIAPVLILMHLAAIAKLTVLKEERSRRTFHKESRP